MSKGSPFDFSNSSGGKSPARPARKVGLVIIFAGVFGVATACTLSCVGGAAYYFAKDTGKLQNSEKNLPNPKEVAGGGNLKGGRQFSQRDWDYLLILLNSYSVVASLSAEQYWRENNPDFAAMNEIFADRAIQRSLTDSAKAWGQAAEESRVARRAEFVKAHGMDSTAWKQDFLKRYPEATVIFDEVKVEVVRKGSEQFTSLQGELLEVHRKFPNKADLEIRRSEYTRKSPKVVAEMRNVIDNLPSILALKKKVDGK